MNNSDDLSSIIDRITNNQSTEADIATLRQLLRSGDRQLSIQLGKYNVTIGEGKEIHIGDRIYQDADRLTNDITIRFH
jgi:Effector-associated domain 10